jgi:hypothetical protein
VWKKPVLHFCLNAHALGDAHEHFGKVDDIRTELPDDLGGRSNNVRALLRTIGPLLGASQAEKPHGSAGV